MVPIHRYSTIVHIDPADAGTGYKYRQVPVAEGYFDRGYPEFKGETELSKTEDIKIQTRLLSQIEKAVEKGENLDLVLAKSEAAICLRCYLSHAVLSACQELFLKFSDRGTRFQLQELLALVLVDEAKPIEPRNQSVTFYHSFQVLQDYFKRDRSQRKSLNGWTYLRTRQSDLIEKFFLSCGLYFNTYWSILNSTSVKELEKIFREFYNVSATAIVHVSDAEIQRAGAILESYHRIYRGDRRKNRAFGRCQPPTENQQQRMVADLQAKFGLEIDENLLIQELQGMAQRLREYRIYCENPMTVGTSLDAVNPVTGREKSEEIADPQTLENSILEETQKKENLRDRLQDFLQDKTLNSLDWGIERAFVDIIASLSRRCAHLADAIKPAFQLFYCQKKSQSEVANKLKITQSQVSRNIKPLAPKLFDRTRYRTQEKLLQTILEGVRGWQVVENPQQRDYFDNLVQQVESFLSAQIFLEAEAQLGDSRTRTQESLYVRRLCWYLCQTREKMPQTGEN